jgi:hypothetical protein
MLSIPRAFFPLSNPGITTAGKCDQLPQILLKQESNTDKRTWAWLPPFPFPLLPPLLPPPLVCLCCWEPVISAILLSICSSRSSMDILNWLSRAEQEEEWGCVPEEKHLTCGLCQLVGLESKRLSVTSPNPGLHPGQVSPARGGREAVPLHKLCLYHNPKSPVKGTENSFFVKDPAFGFLPLTLSLSNFPTETLTKSSRGPWEQTHEMNAAHGRRWLLWERRWYLKKNPNKQKEKATHFF